MANKFYNGLAGSWNRTRNRYVGAGGAWRSVRQKYVGKNGAWHLSYQRLFGPTIGSDRLDFKVYDELIAMGWDGFAINLLVTVSSGIYVRAGSTAGFAIDFQAPLPLGSTVTLVNLGAIQGKGGLGGNGDFGSSPATVGQVGGPAILLYNNITIDNRMGWIQSGGGGGGGGGRRDLTCPFSKTIDSCSGFGGGGGGGAGTGPGGAGLSSNNGSPGTNIAINNAFGLGGPAVIAPCCTNALSGPGGRGGNWGEAGQPGATATTAGGGGGPAGVAIFRQGCTITWDGGGDRVLGAVI